MTTAEVADMSRGVVFRTLDIVLALGGLIVASPLLLILLLVGYADTGSPIFRQERVGRRQRPFVLVKFRTMSRNTLSVPTHMVDPSVVTTFGGFLRRTKLDELPQLWNVLTGDMSMVGPRPCLSTQRELIAARAARGVLDSRPGITGLSQILGIDMSTPELLADTDSRMLASLTVWQYVRYVLLTVLGRGVGDRTRTAKANQARQDEAAAAQHRQSS